MAAFRAGQIDVLVCTTVIEVGRDVPNATVMVVVDADRFGISQLHQLRGRIGRGRHPSLCLLATQLPEGSRAGQRLKAVAGTLDGFKLADLDLQERKEGDVLGLSQSGRPITLRFLSLSEHLDIILAARESSAKSSTRRTQRIPEWPSWQRSSPIPTASSTWTRHEPQPAVVVGAHSSVGRGGRLSGGGDIGGPVPVRRPGRHSHCGAGCRCAGRGGRGADEDPWIRLLEGRVRRELTDNDAPGGHNGCDTRRYPDRDLVDKTYVSIKRCPNAIATGTLHDPYTNDTIAFVRGNQTGAAVQIEHIVPLAYAWDLGARNWTDEMRVRFANDPANLLAVDGPANQDKGDQEPAWMPPNTAFRCQYAIQFIAVLRGYGAGRCAVGPVLREAADTCPKS
jgi:hypothetical protein